MPCLYITTNVNLDGLNNIDPLFSEATTAVASIIGRPQNMVMVVVKGSAGITFGGSKEAAAYGEIVSMGGLSKRIKRQLIASIGYILQTHLGVPTSRFILKVLDLNSLPLPSNL